MKRIAALVFSLAAMASGLAIPGTPSAAAQSATARLVLHQVPAWVSTGGDATLTVGVEPASDDLEVAVRVHAAVRSRSEYERTLTGSGLGASMGSGTATVGDLPRGAAGHLVTVALGEPPDAEEPPEAPDGGDQDGDGEDGDAPRPTVTAPIDTTGVHPVSIELRDPESGAAVDTLVTHLVVLEPDPVATRLSVAWVWPMEVRRPITPDGEIAQPLAEAVGADGRLAQFTDALAAVPDVPITVAPRPATVDAWSRLAATEAGSEVSPSSGPQSAESAAARLAVLRGEVSSGRRQLLAGTYASVDLTALADARLRREITSQLVVGAEALEEGLGHRPDAQTLLASHVDDEVLSSVRERGVDQLVVDPAALVPIFENLTPARPFEVQSRGRSFLAAAGDAGLAALVVPAEGDSVSPAEESDARLAQRLLAGLAVVALEAPGEARGVVVLPEADWAPRANTLVRVLAGLRSHPALEPVTVDTYFDRVPPTEGSNAVRQLVEEQPSRLAADPSAIRAARRELNALATMATEGAAVPAAERLLLLAESQGLRGRTGRELAARYVDAARAAVRAAVGSVRLPGRHTVTLTAREARIPITFQNAGSEPLRVRVRLRSDKLSFPAGSVHEVVLGPRNTTVQLLVKARTSGTFPLTVEVTSPDGTLSIGAVRLTVRSTAVSGAALAVTVGAGVFLAGWWGNHIRKARVRRREREAREAT